MSDSTGKPEMICYSNPNLTRWRDIDHDFSYRSVGSKTVVERNNDTVTETVDRYGHATVRERKFSRVTLRDFWRIKVYTHCQLVTWANAAVRDDAKPIGEEESPDLTLQLLNMRTMNFRDKNKDGSPDFMNVVFNNGVDEYEHVRLDGIDFQPFITSLYEFIMGNISKSDK